MSTEEKLEREGLLASLGGPVPDGDEYAGRFLGQGERCPRLADLIRLAKGEADETTRARLLTHFQECAPCRTWHESYARGWQEHQLQEAGVEDSLAAATSRGLNANRPAPVPLPPLEPGL